MELHGIHHITAITADARGEPGLLLAACSACASSRRPSTSTTRRAYHLYYGDERGHAGQHPHLLRVSRRGARDGPGQGMIHRIVWRVADEAALDFWEERLRPARPACERSSGALRFRDPEGLGLELVVAATQEPPLTAAAGDIPPRHAILRLRRRASLHADPAAQRGQTLGATLRVRRAGRPRRRPAPAQRWRVAGDGRSSLLRLRPGAARRPCAGRRHGAPHRLGGARRRAARLARAPRRRRPARDPDHRSHLLPLRLLPRAERCALRDRHRWAPGSPSTSRRSAWARRCSCRPRYEHLRPRLEQVLTPLLAPRSRAAA